MTNGFAPEPTFLDIEDSVMSRTVTHYVNRAES
jgi:hypothetical protein